MNYSALNTAYNYYMTTYGPKNCTSFDSHKRSELRGVYNNIVKWSKESPLYLLNDRKDYKSFAVGLKENVRSFCSTVASLGGLEEKELLNKKAAYSSNEALVSARYIGDATSAAELEPMEIIVDSLATPQVNLGNYLSPDKTASLPAGTYSFQINTDGLSYEFEFGISPSETNKDVLERLNRLINSADIGISSVLLQDFSGKLALKLTSQKTGALDNRELLFQISDKSADSSGLAGYLGIREVTRKASNARITINGMERSAASNHFTVDKLYEITLNGMSETEADVATVGVQNDTESLKTNIQTLVGGYNSFLQAAAAYIDSQPGTGRLVNELSHIAFNYSDGLKPLGLSLNSQGAFELDESQLSQAVSAADFKQALSSIKDFTNSVLKKSNAVSLNPMEYADKKIVAYKNPGKNYANPYLTSSYSGMLFNSYC